MGVVVVALTAVAPAQAFRRPTSSERAGVKAAFNKKHGKQARKLWVQDIRVSVVDTRYAAVLYDQRGIGLTGKPQGFGPTKLEYYRRRASGKAADRAQAASFGSIIHEFEYLGQDVPASVRDDEDPLYRVKYSTIKDEKITRTTTWSCPDGSNPTTTSQGDYQWSVAWDKVPLSESDFRIGTGHGTLFGTETASDPCPGTSAGGCQSWTIQYRNGPLNLAERTVGSGLGRLLHFGYLQLIVGRSSDASCILLEHGADPILAVEHALPVFWFGSPPLKETWDIDASDFPGVATDGRFGDCRAFERENSCSESLDQFEARITIQRVYRVHH